LSEYIITAAVYSNELVVHENSIVLTMPYPVTCRCFLVSGASWKWLWRFLVVLMRRIRGALLLLFSLLHKKTTTTTKTW